MRRRSVDAIDRTLSWLPWVLLVYVTFVVYGSLLPFEPRPPPTASAWEAFLRLPYLELGVASRADWVANLLLYIPLGFLTVGSAQGRGGANPIHGVAALIVVGAIAVGVEYAQIFFAPRTVSMNDLLAEWLGAAIGVVLWYATHHRLGGLLAETLGRGTRALRAAILLYLAVYLVLAVFPFDFLVSVTELQWRLSTDSWGLLFAPATGGGVVRRFLQLSVDVLATAPLGILIAMDASLTQRQAVRRAAIAGAALGLLVEGLQFLTASGISQGASVVARSGGAVLGVWLSMRVPHWIARPGPSWTRAVLLGALPLYALVLAFLNGWFDGHWLSLEQAIDRLEPKVFLPFYYHYFTTESEAMQSLVANGLMYGLVGVAFWLWVAGQQRGSGPVFPAVLAAGLAAVIEVGKFFAPAKHADPTNVLIAAASAAGAFLLARWVRHVLVPLRPARDQGADLAEGDAGSRLGSQPVPAETSEGDRGDTLGAGSASVSLMLPRDAAGWARFACGAGLLLLAAGVLIRYPLWQPVLGAALAAYAWALWRNPSIWLIVVPALVPSLDLATLSGWYFIDELDLFLLVTVAIALLRPAEGERTVRLPPGAILLVALFGISYAIGTLRGLTPLSPLGVNALSNPHSSFETLRVAKGVIWAFALLPLVQRAFTAPERAGRYLVVGMTLGLLLAGAVVFHERLVFTGLLDFSSDFRATGMFSGMNTGGNEIEAYLVMALPFALLALTRRGGWHFTVLGLLAFVLGTYAVLMTFARGGYAAGAIGLAVAALGLLVARRRGRGNRRLWGRIAGAAVTGGAIVLLVAVTVTGPYMAGRFAGTTGDLQTRWNHWRDAVGMVDDGWIPGLFGMGVGRFPETYFWKTVKDDRPGTFAFIQEKDNRFLRLGPGDPLYLRQKVAVRPETKYRLSLDTRSDEPGMRINVFLCEQTLLYSARCKAQSFGTGLERVDWEAAQAEVDTGEVGSGTWFGRRPVYLGLNYPAGDAPIDVDNVKLVSPEGDNLLRNGDFERGFDFWFFAVDWDPAWHIHNLWVAIFFEQGWLGVVSFLLLAVSSLAAAARSAAHGSRTSAAILGALTALLAAGLVGSPFDYPRISFLFFFLVLSGLIRVVGHRMAGTVRINSIRGKVAAPPTGP